MDRVIGSINKKAVPEVKKNLKQCKYKIVDEEEIKIPSGSFSVEMTSRKCGYLGDYMVKKLIMLSEEQLIGRK